MLWRQRRRRERRLSYRHHPWQSRLIGGGKVGSLGVADESAADRTAAHGFGSQGGTVKARASSVLPLSMKSWRASLVK
jgi:hypothetical protein